MCANFQVIGRFAFRTNPANFLHFEHKKEHLECRPFVESFCVLVVFFPFKSLIEKETVEASSNFC